MNKIMQVFYILTNNLPSKYIVPIKIYKNTEILLRTRVKKGGLNSFEEVVNYYNNYFETHKYLESTFVHTKSKIKKSRAMTIAALATNPISISNAILKNSSYRKIAFVILHEFGHFAKGKNEIKADKFAIKWIKKLIKEGYL